MTFVLHIVQGAAYGADHSFRLGRSGTLYVAGLALALVATPSWAQAHDAGPAPFQASSDQTDAGTPELRDLPEDAGARESSAATPAAPPAPQMVQAPPAAHASSAATPSPSTPAPIEVTARDNPKVERLRRSARAVQVVDLARDRERSADLGEVLARHAGVNVRRAGALGSSTRFMLNGLSGERVRFFLDGIPLALSGFPLGVANVPVSFVDHVAIYRGVVPVALGTDALGGAVDLVTAQDLRRNGADLSYQTGSFGTHRLAASASGYLPETRLFGRASVFHDRAENDYLVDASVPLQGRDVPARVRRFHDAYRASGAHAELGVRSKPWAQRLSLRGFYTDYDKELQTDPLMRNAYGEPVYGKRSWGTQLHYRQRLFSRSLLELTLGYSDLQTTLIDRSYCRYDWYGRCLVTLDQPGEIDRPNDSDLRLHQRTVYGRAVWAWRPVEHHELRFSLVPTYVYQRGRNRAAEAESDPARATRPLLSGVAGVEHELTLFDGAVSNIAFGKGYLQQLATEETLPNAMRRDVDRLTQRLGAGDSLRVRVAEQVMVKASYEYATRLPNALEMFGDGGLTVANLHLSPEKSHNVNFGLEVEGYPSPIGALRVRAEGFGRFTDDLIAKLGGLYYVHENVRRARALGVETSAGWTTPGEYLALDGNFTWQDFRNVSSEGAFGKYEGDRVPNQPYLLANGAARFKVENLTSHRDRLEVHWDTRYVHGFDRGWASQGESLNVESQLTHAIAVTHHVAGDPLSVTSALEVLNLTDERVFDFYGAQRPGRSVFFKLTLQI